jgi:hypothetical protein
MANDKPTTKKPTTEETTVVAEIRPANLVRIRLRIDGESPYVQCAFSQKTRELLMKQMATPKAEKKGRSKDARPPRNFDEDFVNAQHRAAVGDWNGIPARAFRHAMIDACRTVGLVMTTTKLALDVIGDGLDVHDGTPLVRLDAQAPERLALHVRNDNGSVDVRVRPIWREWGAWVTVQFDADMITAQSIANLLDRAGRQVGIGEGRPFSRKSVGMGWGTFRVLTETKEQAA